MHFETTLIRDILLFESGLELGLDQGLDQENAKIRGIAITQCFYFTRHVTHAS